MVRREIRATRAVIPEATSAAAIVGGGDVGGGDVGGGGDGATSAAATSASETGTPVAPTGHPLFAAHREPG